MDRKQFLALGLAATFGPMLPLRALAQDKWPAGPVRLVVPFTPAGTTDMVTRAVATALTDLTGQQFITENKAGAGGTIGADAVAKAPKDGYTLAIGTVSTHAIAPAVMRNLPYRPGSDFTPIGIMGTTPVAVFVHPSVGATTLAELGAAARAKPGSINYGSPGNGSLGHLAGAWFGRLAGADMTHIPYRGSSPAMQDLLAGRVHVMFENVPTPLQHVRSGALRAIAIAAPSRVTVLPDVPTTAEAGFADLQLLTWTMLLAPAGTPQEIVARLNAALNAALRDDRVRALLAELSVDVKGGTPEQAARLLQSEIAKWDTVAKRSGAVLE